MLNCRFSIAVIIILRVYRRFFFGILCSMKKMNLLLICSDQHRYDTLGCYGNLQVETPALDRLARNGAVFENTYCNGPLCVPSRMSFLTGLLPSECEVLTNGDVLDSRRPTFAHMLSWGGYRTALAGRMHFLGPDQHHGFMERLTGDVFPYAVYSTLEKPYAPLEGRLGNGASAQPVKVSGSGSTNRIDYDRAVNTDACNWLRKYAAGGGDSPFMMTVGYWDPHPPYIAPKQYYSKYTGFEPSFMSRESSLHPFLEGRREQIRAFELPEEAHIRAVRAYYGLVSFIDDQVGELIDTLESEGLLDNTAILYFSDHGEMLGDFGLWAKNCFFEPSVKVPMILSLPGKDGKGKRVNSPVSLVDLLPTLSELTGISYTGFHRGESILPLLAHDDRYERPVYSEYYPSGSGRGCRMIRRGKWKYIRYGGYEERELYDVEADPKETVNMADDNSCSGLVRSFEQDLQKDGWTPRVDDYIRGSCHRLGYYDMRMKMKQGISPADYPEEINGFWSPIRECGNYLDE
jgi:choline-sulfatase